MNGIPSFRPDAHIARLRLEHLDERIAPSASRFEAHLNHIGHEIAELKAWVDDHPHWDADALAHIEHGKRWTNHDDDGNKNIDDANRNVDDGNKKVDDDRK